MYMQEFTASGSVTLSLPFFSGQTPKGLGKIRALFQSPVHQVQSYLTITAPNTKFTLSAQRLKNTSLTKYSQFRTQTKDIITIK